MVKYCIAPGCFNTQKDKKLSFHRLPLKRPKLLQKWLQNMRLKDPPLYKSSRVCSAHFTSDCYVRDFKSELMSNLQPSFNLLEEAVPTIFDFTNYSEKATDIPTTSGLGSTAQSSLRKERMQRRSWNKEIQEVGSTCVIMLVSFVI